jgi:transcriptional regulator with XRE-family HTH domain
MKRTKKASNKTTQISEDFAALLDRYLEQTNTRLTEIAASAGISQAYLTMLRQGKRERPSRNVVEALASVLGIPLPEALKAAGLATGAFGGVVRFMTRPQNELLWSCQIEAGQVALRAEVQKKDDTVFQIRLRVTTVDGRSETKSHRLIHWFMDGQEQAAAGASMDGVTFTLQPGEHEFRCRWEGGEELILKVPVGITKPAFLLSHGT